MSSEVLQPVADPLTQIVPAVGHGARRERAGRALTDADGAAFAVDWQVRQRPVEAEAAPAAGPRIQVVPRARGLTFSIARALGTVVVTARGTLDERGSRALGHVLDDLIENQGNMSVLVDLHGVTDVDAGCLDIFVSAHGWAVLRGGQLSLTGAQQRVAAALAATGVDRLVKVTSDRILAVPASGPAVPDRQRYG